MKKKCPPEDLLRFVVYESPRVQDSYADAGSDLFLITVGMTLLSGLCLGIAFLVGWIGDGGAHWLLGEYGSLGFQAMISVLSTMLLYKAGRGVWESFSTQSTFEERLHLASKEEGEKGRKPELDLLERQILLDILSRLSPLFSEYKEASVKGSSKHGEDNRLKLKLPLRDESMLKYASTFDSSGNRLAFEASCGSLTWAESWKRSEGGDWIREDGVLSVDHPSADFADRIAAALLAEKHRASLPLETGRMELKSHHEEPPEHESFAITTRGRGVSAFVPTRTHLRARRTYLGVLFSLIFLSFFVLAAVSGFYNVFGGVSASPEWLQNLLSAMKGVERLSTIASTSIAALSLFASMGLSLFSMVTIPLKPIALEPPVLELDKGALSIEGNTIDLEKPFALRFYENPFSGPQKYLVVEVMQRDMVSGSRIRVQVPVSEGENLGSLQELESDAPVIDQQEFKQTLWPVLSRYTNLHGKARTFPEFVEAREESVEAVEVSAKKW